MSKTLTHAERELDILVKSCPDNDRPIIEEFIPEILALVDKFGNSGQSGGSAPYTAYAISQAVEKLCLQKPICHITGIENEWMSCTDMGDKDLFQNNRCYALFKEGIEGKPYYLDAIIWKTQKGITYSGSALLPVKNFYQKITSRQFIKSYPFEPKTFIVDVIEKEVAPDDWEFYINDINQLKQAFDYYENTEIKL